MPKKQDNIVNSLAHTKWNCKYHIVFAPKYRRKIFYEEKRSSSNVSSMHGSISDRLWK